MRESFVLYTEYADQMEYLDMEQRGILLTAIMAFERAQELPEMDQATAILFSIIKARLERDAARYDEIVEQRREAGKKGAETTNEKRKAAKTANAEFADGKKRQTAHEPDPDPVPDCDPVFSRDDERAPARETVDAYCKERGYRTIDPAWFCEYYESKGWPKDWRAAADRWHKRDQAKARSGTKFSNFPERDYNRTDAEWDRLVNRRRA